MRDVDPSGAPAPVDLGHLVAIIPVRGLERAKTRLGEALDPEERHALVEGLLRLTIRAAVTTPGIRAVAVVSPDPEALAVAADAGAVTLPQGGGGLNEGLADGRAWARELGATALLVIPADLPAIDPRELGRILEEVRDRLAGSLANDRAAGTAVTSLVALVPDRAGEGTNLLLLAPPGAIPFQFGPGSRAAHAGAAARTGAAYLELAGPLGLDLDTPDDLLAAEAVGLGGPAVDQP